MFYLIRAAVMLCRQCRFWTSYKSSKKGGVKEIDTLCRVCSARLRYTYRPLGWTWEFATVAPAHAVGSGGHNKSTSVCAILQVNPEEHNPHELASERNKQIQEQIELRDKDMKKRGFDRA